MQAYVTRMILVFILLYEIPRNVRVKTAIFSDLTQTYGAFHLAIFALLCIFNNLCVRCQEHFTNPSPEILRIYREND